MTIRIKTSHNIKKITLVLHFSYHAGGVKIGNSGTALREGPNTPINGLSTEAGVPLATVFRALHSYATYA